MKPWIYLNDAEREYLYESAWTDFVVSCPEIAWHYHGKASEVIESLLAMDCPTQEFNELALRITYDRIANN